MVLPRDCVVPVWGHAKPGSSVRLQFADQETQATADHQGRWRVSLNPMPASAQNRVMRVTSDGAAIQLRDVLVGEVWLLAGQSNMDFSLSAAMRGHEIIEAMIKAKTIRVYDPPKTVGGGTQAWSMETCQNLTPSGYFGHGAWVRDDVDAINRFSAVGGAFGVKLNKSLGIPIGIIDVSVGGSPTQSWVPRDRVLADPDTATLELDFLDTFAVQDFVHMRPRAHLRHWLNSGSPGTKPEHPYRSGFMYEAGIRPIAPLPIAGILWYQGESNAEDIELHNKLFVKAVSAWRDEFQNDSLPIYWVQLPELNRACWPEFRDAQRRLTKSIPFTGMAVALGNGHPTDVHPRDKVPIGERLARLALHLKYGKEIEDSGPDLISSERVGASMRLRFEHAAGGLTLRLPGKDEPRIRRLSGFWIAGSDRVFRPATIEQQQGNVLTLTHPEVLEPVAVRYAWEANVKPTLYNKEGLPAGPFRTDDWQSIRVACVGDSITHGTGTLNPDSESYPAQLSELLGPLFDVRRFGVPGASVVNGLIQPGTGWDRGFINQRAFDRSVVFNPDVVIINLGINDVVNENFNIDIFLADYVGLINAYRRLPSKPKVVIWGRLAPLFERQQFYGHPRLGQIQLALNKVIEQTGVEMIDMYTPLMNAEKDFPDNLHPNHNGAVKIAEVTRSKLKLMNLPVAGGLDE